MNTNVSWGPASIIGYIAAAAAAIAPIIGQLADDLEPLGVPAQTWVIVSAVLAAITTIGRMWQAAEQAGAVITEPVPEEGGADEPDA
jgi:hypothetical protein